MITINFQRVWFKVVGFLTSVKHYTQNLFVGKLFVEDKQHYLLLRTGISKKLLPLDYTAKSTEIYIQCQLLVHLPC